MQKAQSHKEFKASLTIHEKVNKKSTNINFNNNKHSLT
jgi:hypothetical protein